MSENPPTQASSALRYQWMALSAGSIGIVALWGFAALAEWNPGQVLSASLFPAILTGYLIFYLHRKLLMNYRFDGQLLPTIGLANALTFLRGVLLASLSGFLLLPQPTGALAWAPAYIYVTAITLDYVDGYVARRAGQVTALGQRLDMELDGIGILVAVLLAVRYGQLPWWYLVVGSARYLFLAGIWLRERAHQPVRDLPQSVRRRAFAGAQMGFVGAMLTPLFEPPATQVAAAAFLLPFILGFMLDWFVLTGWLPADWVARSNLLQAVLEKYLPILFRLGVVGLLLALVSPEWRSGVMAAADRGGGQPLAVIAALGLAGLILAGIGGRAAALGALLLLGFAQPLVGPTPILLAGVVCAAGVFFFGTGPLSLWKPEDCLVYRHAGTAE